jgi:CubicO group peptidase (beta-lactamase class C family)
MRKILYILATLVAITVIALVAVQRQEAPKTLESLYDEYELRGHQSGIRSPFSGVVLVARDDEVVFKQAYGHADSEYNEPLDVDARFLVGSHAKPLTATLVLQQVEAEVLDLGGTVSDYLPEFPEELGQQITLHHLLSHTSGLPRDEDEWDELVLDHQPGDAYTFSNVGYDLLVTILEAASGKTYATLLDEGIAVPLGLTDTAFAIGDALTEAVTPGWSFDKHEFPVTIFAPGDGSFNERRLPRAGAVYSTAEDLHRFVRALRSNELLSQAMTERMLTPQLDGNAYGWFRNRQSYFLRNPEAPLYTHEGRLAGHNSVMAFFDDGTTAIVLANVDPLDTVELLTQTYLAAHGIAEVATDVRHPSLSNPRVFKRDGGTQAFLSYYATLTERAGYPVQPPGHFCGQVVQLLIRAEEFEEAVEFADIALEKWPPASPGILNDIGYAFMRRNRFDEARRYLERNIELYPDVSNGYDSLGECHERAGDLKLARKNYTRALEVGQANDDRLQSFYERRIVNIDEMIAGRATTP